MKTKKKCCILLVAILLIISISASAFELSYTALYVGSNMAYVDDVRQQIDIDNPDVCVFVDNDCSYVSIRL